MVSVSRKGISYRLARLSILVAVILGVITTLVETWFDYDHDRRRIDELAERVLQVLAPSAADAAHQLDEELAQQVIEGLFSYDFVFQAAIKDDLGNTLAATMHVPTASNFFWITEKLSDPYPEYLVDLIATTENREVGHLMVSINMDKALSVFYSRFFTNIFAGLARNVLLSLILFAVFQRVITRPLVSLSKDIVSVDPHDPRQLKATIGAANQSNEIGQLEGSMNGLLTASRDKIKELEETQTELQRNEVRINDFVRAASDWFWETDKDHRVTYLSDSFFEVIGVGVDPSDLGQADFDTRVGLDQDGQFAFLAIKKTQRPFRDFWVSFQLPDGETRQVQSSGVPLFDASGNFSGYRGVSADRTDLRQSQLEQKRLADELNHSQKLRAIGQLTGGVAHDFNNLLTILVGSLELARSPDSSDKEVSSAFEMALGATQRGALLTHRLLAFSRQQPLTPKSLDPVQLLLDFENLLCRSLGEQISLEVVVESGTWFCWVDRQELETVLLNLVINARDAMPDGGKIKIKVFNTKLQDDSVEVPSDIVPGPYICFAVSDNGVGMSKDTAERAFDPYFTTKPVGKGSGLGLSMAFGYAKQSGGHIAIDSMEGEGTNVRLYLPKSEIEPDDDPKANSSINDEHLLVGRRALVVEDDDTLRHILKQRLNQAGMDVTVASVATQAIEICSAEPAFDFFLLDVVLPGEIMGPDLSEVLLHFTPNASVVFMSGYTGLAMKDQSAFSRTFKFIQKPFSSTVLKQALLEALRKKQSMPEISESSE
ncbi:MAG: ATP-binding protein [Hyphomicrobiales bacterium]